MRIMIALLLFLVLNSAQELSLTANTKNAYKGKQYIATYIRSDTGGQDQPVEEEFDVEIPETLISEEVWVVTALDSFKMDSVLRRGISLGVSHQRSSETHLTFLVQSRNANYIQSFHISYLIIRKNSLLIHNFHPIHLTLHLDKNLSKESPFQTRRHIPQSINPAMNLKLFYLISGMDVTSPNSLGIIDIRSVIEIFDSFLHFSIISQEQTPTFVAGIAFSIIIYNQDLMQSSFYIDIETGNKQSYIDEQTMTPLSYFSSQTEMLQFNTFLGFTSFRIAGDQFHLSTFVKEPYTNRQGDFGFEWVVKAEARVRYLNVCYLVIFTQYCDYLYPYYHPGHHSCYSKCPDASVKDTAALECISQDGSDYTQVGKEQQGEENNIWTWTFILLVIVIISLLLFLKKRKQNKRDYRNFNASSIEPSSSPSFAQPLDQLELTQSNMKDRYSPLTL